MELNNLTLKVWKKAKKCSCGEQGCQENHRLCAICGKKMIYNAHESSQPTSSYVWNVDHINPVSKGGTDNLENLQAVHVVCNQSKKNN